MVGDSWRISVRVLKDGLNRLHSICIFKAMPRLTSRTILSSKLQQYLNIFTVPAAMAFIIPYPLDTDITPLVIQYPILHSSHTFPEYDSTLAGEFLEYPRKCQFGTDKNLDLNKDEVDVAAFMQSWLFTGLLKEILNDRDEKNKIIDPWIDRMGGKMDIRIDACLEEHLLKLRRQSWKDFGLLLGQARDFCDKFEEKPVEPESLLALTCLSVRLLLDHLRTLAEFRMARPEPAFKERFKPFSAKGHSSCAELLLQRFQRGGRCPWRVKSAHTQLDCATLYFLSSLRSLQPIDKHKGCNAGGDICTPSIKSFEAVHTEQGCQCSEISPLKKKSKEINKIIDAGNYPLISMSHDAAGQIALRIVPSSINAKYTAISHVWSDGELGFDENHKEPPSFYECQLRNLGRMLQNLERLPSSRPSQFDCITSLWRRWRPSEERLFWLDSLCIPADTERRKLQISRMSFIYAQANEVLVLDKELKNIVSSELEPVQAVLPSSADHRVFIQQHVPVQAPGYDDALTILAHITCSTWMGRAWTLQEGILSRDCIFQLRNCSVRLRSLAFENYSINPSYLFPRFPVRVQAILMSLRMYSDWRQSHQGLKEILFALLFSAVLCLEIVVLLLIPWPGDRLVRNGIWHHVPRRRSTRDPSGIEYRRIFDTLSNRLQRGLDTNPLDHSDKLLTDRFMKIWNMLLDRLATKEEDYITIVSTLAGFEVSELLDFKSSLERLRYVFLKLEWIPRSILFEKRPHDSRQLKHGDTPNNGSTTSTTSNAIRSLTVHQPYSRKRQQESQHMVAHTDQDVQLSNLRPSEPATTLHINESSSSQTSLYSVPNSVESLATLGVDFDWWVPSPCREELTARTNHDKLYIENGAIAFSPQDENGEPVLLYKLDYAKVAHTNLSVFTLKDPQDRIWQVSCTRSRYCPDQGRRMGSVFLFLQNSFRAAPANSKGETYLSAAVLFERSSFPLEEPLFHYFEYDSSVILKLLTETVAGGSHVTLKSNTWPTGGYYHILHGGSPRHLLDPDHENTKCLRHKPRRRRKLSRPLTKKTQVLFLRSWLNNTFGLGFFLICYPALTVFGMVNVPYFISGRTLALIVLIGIPFYIWIPVILLDSLIQVIDYYRLREKVVAGLHQVNDYYGLTEKADAGLTQVKDYYKSTEKVVFGLLS